MKKIWVIVFFIFCFLLGVLVVQSKNRKENEMYYVLPQAKSYVYQNGRKMSFEIYSTKKEPLISYVDSNQYQLICDNMIYMLEDVHVKCVSQNKMELVIIEANIPDVGKDDFYCKKGKLKIINSNFEVSFDFGSLSIISPNNYTLLGIDEFYASYAYVNKVLKLVGINITFTKNYHKLSSVCIGNAARGHLKQAQANRRYENEMDIIANVPDYQPYGHIMNNEELLLEDRMYFIPVVYENLYLIKQGYLLFKLDDEMYYLDTLSFIVNDISFEDYKEEMKKGEFKNA